MSSRMPCLLCVVLALTAVLPAATADNPKVSLKVAGGTCAEAVAALSKAAGISLEIYSAPTPVGVPAPPAPGLEERASFDWSDLSFARALRRLCERYGLRPMQHGGGYTLYPGDVAAPAAPAKRVGLVEKNGVRLFARGMSVSMNRRVSFVGDPNGFNNSYLSLELGCELESGDGDAIAGLDNVSARDDTGNVMVDQAGRSSSFSTSQYPDEWQGGINMGGFNPRAKKLEWVEGDLMVYKRYLKRHLEFSLPLPAEGARQRVGDTVVELSRFEPIAGPEGGAGPARPAGRGPKLQVRLTMPRPDDGALGSGMRLTPILVGASGRTYWQASEGNSTRGDDVSVTQEMNAEFAGIQEPVTRAVVEWVEKSRPVKLFSFRMENIPLPPEGAFIPRRGLPLPPPRTVVDPAPAWPYEQKGGGILVNGVHIQQRTAPEGTLSLGLALKTGGEWSAIRWQDVDVDREGVARLADLKPGTYRLIRTYHPREALALGDVGRWLNGEVQVSVTAGKETAAPPLRWEPEPEEKKPAAPPARTPITPLKKAPGDGKGGRS